MHWIVLHIMLQASDIVPLEVPTSDPNPTEVSTPSEEMKDCKEGVKSLSDDFKGLELYLQDKIMIQDLVFLELSLSQLITHFYIQQHHCHFF